MNTPLPPSWLLTVVSLLLLLTACQNDCCQVLNADRPSSGFTWEDSPPTQPDTKRSAASNELGALATPPPPLADASSCDTFWDELPPIQLDAKLGAASDERASLASFPQPMMVSAAGTVSGSTTDNRTQAVSTIIHGARIQYVDLKSSNNSCIARFKKIDAQEAMLILLEQEDQNKPYTNEGIAEELQKYGYTESNGYAGKSRHKWGEYRKDLKIPVYDDATRKSRKGLYQTQAGRQEMTRLIAAAREALKKRRAQYEKRHKHVQRNILPLTAVVQTPSVNTSQTSYASAAAPTQARPPKRSRAATPSSTPLPDPIASLTNQVEELRLAQHRSLQEHKASLEKLQKELKDLAAQVSCNSAFVEKAVQSAAVEEAVSAYQKKLLETIQADTKRGEEQQKRGLQSMQINFQSAGEGGWFLAAGACQKAIEDYKSAKSFFERALGRVKKVNRLSEAQTWTEKLRKNISDVEKLIASISNQRMLSE